MTVEISLGHIVHIVTSMWMKVNHPKCMYRYVITILKNVRYSTIKCIFKNLYKSKKCKIPTYMFQTHDLRSVTSIYLILLHYTIGHLQIR